MELIPTVQVKSPLESEFKKFRTILNIAEIDLPDDPDDRENAICGLLEAVRDFIDELELRYRLKEIEAKQKDRLLQTIARLVSKQQKPQLPEDSGKISLFKRFWKK